MYQRKPYWGVGQAGPVTDLLSQYTLHGGTTVQ